jgi:pyrroloquinoline quinone biosynthesis protein B
MKNVVYYSIFLLLLACGEKQHTTTNTGSNNSLEPKVLKTSLILLGTIQDAGSPHIGCKKECCSSLFNSQDNNRKVISLGLFDASTNKKYIFEATPDIATQMKLLKNFGVPSKNELADGIFLTHAHMGHYTGLMYLGKEATDAKNIPVFAMPKMKSFLESNGPWSQLVTRNNIELKLLQHNTPVALSKELAVTPFIVPHRDEFSETVGYKIQGPNKSALFIPDIDKWRKWDKNIAEEIKKVEYAFLDATFFSGKEINNRDISQIPHPFIIESLKAFEHLSLKEKGKIIFIHFNHTNPVINIESEEAKIILAEGFKIGQLSDFFDL